MCFDTVFPLFSVFVDGDNFEIGALNMELQILRNLISKQNESIIELQNLQNLFATLQNKQMDQGETITDLANKGNKQ